MGVDCGSQWLACLTIGHRVKLMADLDSPYVVSYTCSIHFKVISGIFKEILALEYVCLIWSCMLFLYISMGIILHGWLVPVVLYNIYKFHQILLCSSRDMAGTLFLPYKAISH